MVHYVILAIDSGITCYTYNTAPDLIMLFHIAIWTSFLMQKVARTRRLQRRETFSLAGIANCRKEEISIHQRRREPVPMAARSKAQAFGLSPAGIVGSNPTGDMDVL